VPGDRVATCRPRIGRCMHTCISGPPKVVLDFTSFGPNMILRLTCRTSAKPWFQTPPPNFNIHACGGPDMINDHQSGARRSQLTQIYAPLSTMRQMVTSTSTDLG
jgi:hypothetical protein